MSRVVSSSAARLGRPAGRRPAAGAQAAGQPLDASGAHSGNRAREAMHSARVSLGRTFRVDSSNFFLLLGLTLFMVAFGLLMVLSSSYVESHTDGSSFFSKFLSQATYAIVGVPLMMVVSRLPVRFFERIAWLLLAATCFLQLLVVFTPLGVGINGNRNWLELGPFTFQPSEGIKLALIVWLAMFLQRKQDRIREWRYALVPVLLVSGVSLGLVLAGHDLGTTMVMAVIVLGALFFAGIPLRHLAVLGLIAAGMVFVFVVTSANRMGRITAAFSDKSCDPNAECFQVTQGMWGMANGGVFGVGLGNSQSKWDWLPASSTDFIFAITAEELGLIGGILVLVMFVGLALVFVRTLRSAQSMFARVATGAILTWILFQALVNIAVVLGVLPVLGVPLPLISAGGTALVSTLIGIGVVLSFTRHEEAARAETGTR